MRSAGGTIINTVRARGIGENALVARLRLSRLLENAELRAEGVPPSAVLLVRRMNDPLPGRLSPDRALNRPDAGWERAAGNVLAHHARRAVRPERGFVPPDSDAILFADQTEMLACLALDLVRGGAAARWWWKAIMRSYPLSVDGLTIILRESARYVPGVFHHLNEWRHASSFAAALSPRQAEAILSEVLAEYGVPDFRAGSSFSKWSPDSFDRTQPNRAIGGKSTLTSDTGDNDPLPPEIGDTGFEAAAPWENRGTGIVVPQGLSLERACLVGLSFMLHYEPHRVRTEAFQREIRLWWVGQKTSFAAGQKHPSFAVSDHAEFHSREEQRINEPESKFHDQKTSADAERAAYGEAPGMPGSNNVFDRAEYFEISKKDEIYKTDGRPEQRRTQHDGQDQEQISGQEERAADFMRITTDPQIADEPPALSKAIGHSTDARTSETLANTYSANSATGNSITHGPVQFSREGIRTRIGGALYLINVMKHLGLPGCCEEEWKLASTLGVWGTLDALARGLLAEFAEDLEHDPLWQILAELDDRDTREMPGKRLGRAAGFHLPAGWQMPVTQGEERAFYWGTNGDRLRVWTPETFLVIDCNRDRSSGEAQALKELKPYLAQAKLPVLLQRPFADAPYDRLKGRLVTGMNQTILDWLGMALPYVKNLIIRALAAGDSGAETIKHLVCCPGRLFVTSSHIDLVMNLESISLSARRAGLDRDPGWLPDWGRVVQFHYN